MFRKLISDKTKAPVIQNRQLSRLEGSRFHATVAPFSPRGRGLAAGETPELAGFRA
jgi:hypothetical protein